jgi:flavin reductase (DIM6/NTAB) family NADH-FMN oxidoreductase RutF
VTVRIFSPPSPDTIRLRSVLGQFATGVTVVASGGATPCGMTVNSFASVSIDPPLILVCVTRGSELGKAVHREGCFAVSVLAAQQEDLARYFANHARPRGAAEFDKVRWSPGPGTGAPVLDDALTWLDCAVATTYDGADHEIFLGSVLASGARPDRDALLFFRGGFCRLPAGASAARAAGGHAMTGPDGEIR